jgi:photoactive yellow protein
LGAKETRAKCSWCGTVVRKRGICQDCENQAVSLGRVSLTEFDRLPYGAIKLDEEGVIVRVNRRERALSGLHAKDYLGKNFFDVAPCAKVRAFRGRYQSFLNSGRRSHEFNFVYRIRHSQILVRITFVRLADGALILASQRKG